MVLKKLLQKGRRGSNAWLSRGNLIAFAATLGILLAFAVPYVIFPEAIPKTPNSYDLEALKFFLATVVCLLPIHLQQQRTRRHLARVVNGLAALADELAATAAKMEAISSGVLDPSFVRLQKSQESLRREATQREHLENRLWETHRTAANLRLLLESFCTVFPELAMALRTSVLVHDGTDVLQSPPKYERLARLKLLTEQLRRELEDVRQETP